MADELVATWERLMSLFGGKRDEFFAVLGQNDLTPPHAHALTLLVEHPMRMNEIAESLSCDASYVTALVDRLEALALAERQPCPTDRRAKEIALTPQGRRVTSILTSAFATPPPDFDVLTPKERATLAQLVAKVVPEPDQSGFPLRPPRRP
jgi:DNA-binding MarR family transcriptional regulator